MVSGEGLTCKQMRRLSAEQRGGGSRQEYEGESYCLPTVTENS